MPESGRALGRSEGPAGQPRLPHVGGQQQRLSIARALSHRPRILCLDEFSIAIDPVTTMRIEETSETPSSLGIVTRNLNLRYGNFQALKNVDLGIEDGKITALIGPSGCGKTTLLRCFNRVNERYGNVRTTSEIALFGKNIHDPDVLL